MLSEGWHPLRSSDFIKNIIILYKLIFKYLILIFKYLSMALYLNILYNM